MIVLKKFLSLLVIGKDCLGVCWRIVGVIGKDEILEGRCARDTGIY